MNKISIIAVILLLITPLSSCNNVLLDKLEKVGKEPELKVVAKDLDRKATPLNWPEKSTQKTTRKRANSLWHKNAHNIFADSRARNIGDILTVKVQLKEKAELDNKTERKRSSNDSMGASSIFGLEKLLTGFLPGKADPTSLLSLKGSMDNKGEGVIEREETVEFDVAAVVKQVLANNNLVIYGSQEMRINHEIRQITIEGVVRKQDIGPNNTVDLKRIAEARVSYGGKGLISDVQQPRIGNQIIDIVTPW